MIFNDYHIYGTDISFYQGYPPKFPVVDFRKMRAHGASFVIIKAGQANYADPAFRYNWPAAKGILPRAPYWYYDNNHDPRAQAAKFWDIVKPDLEGILWLDLEDRDEGTYKGWRAWYDFIEALKYVSKLPDERIGIYTGISYWKEYTLGAREWEVGYFRKFPLWLAYYGSAGWNMFEPDCSEIRLPSPFTDNQLVLLQTGAPVLGPQMGVSSLEIDYDILNGNTDRLRQLFPFEEVTLPPTEEVESMITGTCKLTTTPNARVRKGNADGTPDPVGMTIGAIMPGQEFKASEKKYDTGLNHYLWLHIVEVGGKPIDGWTAAHLLDWQEVVTPPPPPPTLTLPDIPVSIVLGDDITYVKQTLTTVLKPKV